MNQRDYAIYHEGRAAAANGAGLSDSPHGGRDGILWRQGARAWLNENDQAGEKTKAPKKKIIQAYADRNGIPPGQDDTGGSISSRRL
jgi:hypothetical protein